ncbi:rhamnulokinase [Paenibacillus cisolokensis]|uniref:Rhamnulokinase n=1 Tax=Paenibacillus cisolokensis TaxID=1658519 RepID=A0ABQ4N199_9BACL|nr:rhamnulokinase family protein [Paenibacillus cisolokensis]GIQ61934.1 rhamnulokinase [Paenibacillus cisolokensis]
MKALAIDLGAGSGRAVVGSIEEGRISVREAHRFPNEPVAVGNRLYWDILRLYHEVKQGIRLAVRQENGCIGSIGIDSWAVDFGLISGSGELLGNPYHYRDAHTADAIAEVLALPGLSEAEVFNRTGIQFLNFNTIYQLHALVRDGNPALAKAERLLMIPDLLRYFLTGEMHSEFTNTTTTQLFNPIRGDWDDRLIGAIGIDRKLFLPPVQPGTRVGRLRPEVTAELGVPAIPLIAVGEHDTASAVAAVPALDEHFAYLSCGTWSLMGTEVRAPVITDEARAMNFTNEGGVCGTYRLLKNIMGLWILEECKRRWEKERGSRLDYAEMLAAAEAAPAFRSFIDPDDGRFLHPPDMPEAIRSYCRERRQPVPESIGETVRCILESLALKYRYVLECTERLTGKTYKGLHMVGGGLRNELLCRYTAAALGRPVWAGPTEGSALGNLAVQWIATGAIKDIAEARAMIRASFPVRTYEPADREAWTEAYRKFAALLALA